MRSPIWVFQLRKRKKFKRSAASTTNHDRLRGRMFLISIASSLFVAMHSTTCTGKTNMRKTKKNAQHVLCIEFHQRIRLRLINGYAQVTSNRTNIADVIGEFPAQHFVNCELKPTAFLSLRSTMTTPMTTTTWS